MLERNPGPDCPRCGCNDCGIIRRPTNGDAWFGRQHGRAQCRSCGLKFQITPADAPETVPPPIEAHEPVVETHEPVGITTRTVKYQIYCCEDCGEKLRVYRTKGSIRHLKCQKCGATYKIGSEERVTLTK